ncbi:hypothetical protein Anapl_16181 [Anas platyrhynchos]|uniref:Uncharacterized protein n=1 Tax=Anas platyrhynchos TaxID=8839 RepID=R0KN10_ANAPL|nr:hypothetical protein Anapl_16181 [Anas platyrhynchos]
MLALPQLTSPHHISFLWQEVQDKLISEKEKVSMRGKVWVAELKLCTAPTWPRGICYGFRQMARELKHCQPKSFGENNGLVTSCAVDCALLLLLITTCSICIYRIVGLHGQRRKKAGFHKTMRNENVLYA